MVIQYISTKIKYRLYGIDAPEIKQMCKINKKNYECGKMSKKVFRISNNWRFIFL